MLPRPRVPLRRQVHLRRPGGDVPSELLPALEGRWAELPEPLSVEGLNALAHMVNGYDIASEHLGREVSALATERQAAFRDQGTWEGDTVELLAVFFAVVRGWRGLYEWPKDGDKHHQEAQSLYAAVRERLRTHPDEVELVPVAHPNGESV